MLCKLWTHTLLKWHPPWHSLQQFLSFLCSGDNLLRIFRFQVSSTSKAAPMAVLTPDYDGPILDPCTGTQQTYIGGIVFVDCIATAGNQTSVGTSVADIVSSEAGAAADTSSSDNLDTTSAPTDNPTVAQAPCHHSSASMDVSMAAHCASATCSFDASDRPDYAADVAEALARLCKRASEDGQGQSANQAVTDCKQQHVQTAADITLNPPAAAAANDDCTAADSPQSSAGPQENLSTACSVSAGDACDSTDVVYTAMAASLVSSEVQHAAVDQVLEELLAEVSAPLQSVQSSTPADSAADIVSDDLVAMVAQHAAVDQVVDDLLDEVAAPFQAVQSSMPADISGMVSPRFSLLAKSSEGPVEDLNSGCSESADDAAETISDDDMAMVDAMMTNELQHAAVDQVLDDLLDEVAAPLQSVQSSTPADISGRVSPMVSPRVSLLATSCAPQQAGSMPAVPAPDSCYVSSTIHSQPLPPATADKRSSAELSPAVPSSSSMSGKENIPVVEARHVSKEVKQVVGAMGRGRGRVCCLDRSTFQEMAQALPTEPSSQVLQLTMVPSH